MKFLSNVFVALCRLAGCLNRSCDLLDGFNSDLESRLAHTETPRLTAGDVIDREADTVDLPAAPAETRRNGKAARR